MESHIRWKKWFTGGYADKIPCDFNFRAHTNTNKLLAIKRNMIQFMRQEFLYDPNKLQAWLNINSSKVSAL